VQGFSAPRQLLQPPVSLRVTVDGVPLPESSVTFANGFWEVSYALPNEAVGKKELLLGLEAGRTFHVAGDDRELGLNISVIEIR